jgi:hypothetical protein
LKILLFSICLTSQRCRVRFQSVRFQIPFIILYGKINVPNQLRQVPDITPITLYFSLNIG